MTDRERRAKAFGSFEREAQRRYHDPKILYDLPGSLDYWLASAESEAAHWERKVEPLIWALEWYATHIKDADQARRALAAFRAESEGKRE